MPSVDYALAYAKLGWPVVPCRGKVPFDGRRNGSEFHGYNSATCDPGQIRSWWRHQPDANIGLATGHAFFALDVDGDRGEESLMALTDRFGDMPDTLTQITGGGGLHLLFKSVSGLRNWSASFHIDGKMVDVPGLDIRTAGSGIISSPSIHSSGRRYQWKDGYGPRAMLEGKIEIAAAPQWLVDIATPLAPPVVPLYGRTEATDGDGSRAAAYVRGALDGHDGALNKIMNAPDGQQSFTLYQQSWAIGGFVGAGALDEKTAFDALYAAGLQMPSYNPKRPWRPYEIAATIKRGLRLGSARPRCVNGGR